jgi:Uma2 family endonuclease
MVLLSVGEYTRLAALLAGRRTELVDGQVIEMPAISTAHYTVTGRLLRQLAPLVSDGRLAIAAPVIVTDFDEPEPDVCVLHHPVELRKIVPADIALLIEVGDRTATYDRETKLPRYQAAGVTNVWLVNIGDHAHPRLEIYPPNQSRETGVVPVPFAGLVVNLDDLFAGLDGLATDEQGEASGS